MARRKKLIWGIGIVLLLIVTGVIISQTNLFAIGDCGGTVLSIDNADIVFSNELQKDVIRVVYSTVPTSECLRIRLTKSSIENLLPGFDVTDERTGDIFLTKNDKVFQLAQQSGVYREIEVENRGFNLLCTIGGCSNSQAFSAFRDGSNGDCICYSDKDVGREGEILASTDLIWETTIEIDGVGEVKLDQNTLSGAIGNVAFVKWAGNLGANGDVTQPDRDSYFHLANNQYSMVDDGVFAQVDVARTLLRGELIQCNTFSGNCPSPGTHELQALGYNQLVAEKTINGLSNWVNVEPRVKDAQIINNELEVILASPAFYPTFTLDIAADFVGVFISVGEPEVTCPADFAMNSGDRETQDVVIKNIGSNSGAFSWNIDCGSGSTTSNLLPPQTIPNGGSITIGVDHMLIVGEGTETAACTFTAVELNTLEEDSCTYSFDSTHVSTCTLDERACAEGNTQLWTCLADGTYKKDVCEFGCGQINGVIQCLGQAATCGVTGSACTDTTPCCQNAGLMCSDDNICIVDSDDKDCEPWLKAPRVLGGATIIPNIYCKFIKPAILTISIVIGILAFFVGLGLSRKLMQGQRIKKQWKIVVMIIIGAAIGIGVGYTFFLLWWLGLLILVAFFVYAAIKKKLTGGLL